MSKGDPPWCDRKVAFGVLDGFGIFDKFEGRLWRDRLPAGWEVNEMDATGARCVMIFRVTVLPTIEDGRVVRRLLQRMEPRVRKRKTAVEQEEPEELL